MAQAALGRTFLAAGGTLLVLGGATMVVSTVSMAGACRGGDLGLLSCTTTALVLHPLPFLHDSDEAGR